MIIYYDPYFPKIDKRDLVTDLKKRIEQVHTVTGVPRNMIRHAILHHKVKYNQNNCELCSTLSSIASHNRIDVTYGGKHDRNCCKFLRTVPKELLNWKGLPEIELKPKEIMMAYKEFAPHTVAWYPSEEEQLVGVRKHNKRWTGVYSNTSPHLPHANCKHIITQMTKCIEDGMSVLDFMSKQEDNSKQKIKILRPCTVMLFTYVRLFIGHNWY